MQTHSAGGVVIHPSGRVAVVSQHGRSWSLPKGHVEPGEDFLSAAKREIFEECGLSQLQYLGELGSYSRYKIAKEGGDDTSELKHLHFYAFTTTENVLQGMDPDNPEAVWISSFEAVERLTHPKDRAFFSEAVVAAFAKACVVIQTTFPNFEEADRFQRLILEAKLAACVQIWPISSRYVWEGDLFQSDEYRCEIKTSVFKQMQALDFLKKNHSYTLPEQLILPIRGGDLAYLVWIVSN